MRDGWTSFRGQQIGVPLLFGGALLAGALGAFVLTGGAASGGSPASPAAAGPVPTQAAAPTTAPPTTQAQPSTAVPARKAASAKSGKHYLCIYPGVRARHIISPLPGGVTRATWAITCRSTDGKPAIRVSASLFEEPDTHQFFRLQRSSADGFYVLLTPRS